mmetsp:Transcript_48278/g.95308  ORF Transcript_48278/g.95308 Transcript_48278/m.95308 type:complete len:138 (+) Transcript_48278:857-1270(+)
MQSLFEERHHPHAGASFPRVPPNHINRVNKTTTNPTKSRDSGRPTPNMTFIDRKERQAICTSLFLTGTEASKMQVALSHWHRKRKESACRTTQTSRYIHRWADRNAQLLPAEAPGSRKKKQLLNQTLFTDFVHIHCE